MGGVLTKIKKWLAGIVIVQLAVALMMPGLVLASSPTTVVGWTFPNGSTDAVADVGLAVNLSKTIEGVNVENISYTANGPGGGTDNAAIADHWQEASGKQKYWQISFDSTGYKDLTLSSQQRSSSAGPSDFRIEYRIGASGAWTAVSGGTLKITNDSWHGGGDLTSLVLPNTVNDQGLVYLRWLVTTNFRATSNPSHLFMDEDGTNRIDNIFVYAGGVIDHTPPELTLNGGSSVDVYYGDGYTDPGATCFDGVDGSIAPTVGGAVITPTTPVGVYHITYDCVDSSSNRAGQIVRTVNVLPRPITVMADAKSKVYGQIDPVLTYSVSSFPVAPVFTGELVRATGENVGHYAIDQGTLSAGSNFAINYIGADLIIGPARITVTADTKAKIYGGPDPVLTYALTSGSLISGDSLSGSLTRTPGENIGSYPILQGTLSAGSNYELTYVGANLTISSAVLVVTADNGSKTYGSLDPVFTFHITGFTGEDGLGSISVLPTCTVPSTHTGVGTYSIVCSGGVAENYIFSYTSGSFTVTTAPLVVIADAKTKFIGAVDPALTYTIVGTLFGSDTLTGGLARTPGEGLGIYPVDIGNLGNPNYQITFVPNTLTIVAIPVPTTPVAPTTPAPVAAVTALIPPATAATVAETPAVAGAQAGNVSSGEGAAVKGSSEASCPWWWIVSLVLLAVLALLGGIARGLRETHFVRKYYYLWPPILSLIAWVAHRLLQDGLQPTWWCTHYWFVAIVIALMGELAYGYLLRKRNNQGSQQQPSVS